MKTMLEYLEENGIEVPEGEVNSAWFKEHHLPMIVRCTDCDSTMVLFSAKIDDEGFLYCQHCAQIFEADKIETALEKK